MERFIKLLLSGLFVYLIFLSIDGVFELNYHTNFLLLGLTPEELESLRTKTVRPMLYLTGIYFIFRYFTGKNPTSTVWPVYVMFASFCLTQFIAFFTSPFSVSLIISFLLSLFVTVILRIAHNKRQQDVSTF
tara:strand:- start:160 stop:555 length:396 start_codon:yes stop_codon:yes gene_type:complete